MNENMQLCRICISNSECATMVPIFGEDLLWKKITMLANVKIEKEDTLPQQVCLLCAKATISACMLKQKCEDADNFFRNHLQMMRKMETLQQNSKSGGDVISISEGSDNDDIMNFANKHFLANNNPNLQLINGNRGLNENQFENKDNYDLNNIRMMMNNYSLMEQQNKEADAMAMFNDYRHQDNTEFQPPTCDVSMDDDQLPLIPEIELITPNDETTDVMERPTVAHSQGQGYQCSICYQMFVRKFLLKDHLQNCHGRSPPVYECSNCKKSYLYKRFLEKHIRRGRCAKKRRNQTRPMECTDCHVLFPTGHHLGWHKRTGCPSRTSKVPLQQLLKQNIVQYNNFPKPIIPTLRPDNALYTQNKGFLPNNSKRKGRTRIKLDATKIALAKMLILKEATTTQIAQELDISRTFAWRLRKNLVNGVSLDERFVNPQGEQNIGSVLAPEIYKPTTVEQVTTKQNEEIEIPKALEIKQEVQEEEANKNEDDDEDDEDDSDSDTDSDSDSESDSDSNSDDDDDEDENDSKEQANENTEQQTISQDNEQSANHTNGGRNHMQQLKEETNLNGIPVTTSATEIDRSNTSMMQDENDESDSEDDDDEENDDDDNENDNDDSDDSEDDGEEEKKSLGVNNVENQMQRYQQQLMQVLPSVFHIPQQGFPQPVNLSIKSTQNQNTNLTPATKKPRKPNVFIDDEKYARAKILVSQNSSTMEIARQLNVSQMTAWKLRDAIVKGIPLSYRSKRESRPKPPEKTQKTVVTSTPKEKLPRRRLKAAERELRDREITQEILEMIKEDSNIQYWKISAKLAEKGYIVSPSSVCQKLKALGIHRRWKPGDKPPILDSESFKAINSGGGGTVANELAARISTDSFEFNNEQQFELGGAHFLSAFTH